MIKVKVIKFSLKVVSNSEHRGADHLPPGFLRVPGGQEVVGAVLQAALARQVGCCLVKKMFCKKCGNLHWFC